MTPATHRPGVMSIAGSDSGGGAGIQADLLTFARLGAFGTTAITCVTAQNLDGVSSVVALPPEAIVAQIDAILTGFPIRAAKTGMLYSREIIEAVAARVSRGTFPALVVDPVMVATSGARLLQDDAVSAYEEKLLPLALVMTPNLDEAAVFLRRPIPSALEMPEAARELGERYGCAVLLKGGHLSADDLVDCLWDGERIQTWTSRRVTGVITHGTGCRLSAALAAHLAFGEPLVSACAKAREYVAETLANPTALDGGIVLGW